MSLWNSYHARYSTWDAACFIYLDYLYLEDDYRSNGIGQVLMEKVKEHGKTRGCVNMQWQTPDFNERAIKFYKRIGGTGKNKVRFSLPLQFLARSSLTEKIIPILCL